MLEFEVFNAVPLKRHELVSCTMFGFPLNEISVELINVKLPKFIKSMNIFELELM